MSISASIPELSQAIRWLSLGFHVPADWEIVRHGIAFERGSLVFVDRARQRLSVSWTECPRAPDLERLRQDFQSQPLFVGHTVLSCQDSSGFRVMERRAASGERVTQALRFDPVSSRLIELELPGLAEREDPTLTEALLAGFAFAGREQACRLCAFGVRADLPEGFQLTRSQVKPADVSLEFERPTSPGERLGGRLRIRRSGMARAWFSGDLVRTVAARNTELAYREFAQTTVGPHAATVASGFPRGAILKRVFGKVALRRTTCWECAEQNAVFETELCLPAKHDPAGVAARLWCCGEPTEEPRNGN